MLSFIKNLFKREMANCYICNKKIYEGDFFGHERDSSELAIGGYFNYFFCTSCIERRCMCGNIDQTKLGEVYIISDGRERHRITIYNK